MGEAGEHGPEDGNGQPALALELHALSARVAGLELELGSLRSLLASGVLAAGHAPLPSATSTPPASTTFAGSPPPAVLPLPRTRDDGAPGGLPDGLPAFNPAASSAQTPRAAQASAGQASARQARTLEERFGSQLFNGIGIAALFIAASLALKLAVDRGLVTPLARVLLGLAAGVGVVLWSERFRRRGLQAFSWSLKAIGSGVLYLTLWAAYQLFHLLPAGVALAAMVAVTAWNAALAWSEDAELLAGYALAGGFATPLLLAGTEHHGLFLLCYLVALDLGLVVVLRYRRWNRLLLPAFFATAFYELVVYFADTPRHFSGPTLHDPLFWRTALFSLVFAALFAVVSMRGFVVASAGKGEGADAALPAVRGASISPNSPASGRHAWSAVLLPLLNAAFLWFALRAALDSPGSSPWLAVALAAVYLGLVRLQRGALATALHLACAIVFLTIAIPLEAKGDTLSGAWLVEGLLLLWIATRLGARASLASAAEAQTGEPEREASRRVLRALSAVGYGLGLLALSFRLLGTSRWEAPGTALSLHAADLGSALVAVAALGGAAALLLRRSTSASATVAASGSSAPALAALAAIDYVGLLLVVRDLFFGDAGFGFPGGAGPSVHATVGSGLVYGLPGVTIVAGCTWIAFAAASRVASQAASGAAFRAAGIEEREASSSRDWRLFVGGSLVLANLLALAVGVHAIALSFGGAGEADSDLKRSLTISAFLMIYGACLLAGGFLRRSAPVRWQALILILFTILKVFLYDVSALSAGYRIASLFGLGALLMAVSLAYQRDWLGLRAAAEPVSTQGEGETAAGSAPDQPSHTGEQP